MGANAQKIYEQLVSELGFRADEDERPVRPSLESRSQRLRESISRPGQQAQPGRPSPAGQSSYAQMVGKMARRARLALEAGDTETASSLLELIEEGSAGQ